MKSLPFAQGSIGIKKLKKQQTFTGADYYKGLFSPDGSLVALVNLESVDIKEISTDRLIYRFNPPTGNMISESFSPDGRFFAIKY